MTHILQTYPWLQSSWSRLELYISQNRIPQALLLSGNNGFGKLQLASFFSQSILCSSPEQEIGFCGKCQSCKLFEAKTHPDFILIEPEEAGKAIGIDVIRQLTVKLALKPQFEAYRIVIINFADCLSNASANAFLKYLEEPTERTSLILITDKPLKLPATIRSRCQEVPVSASDEMLVKTWLKKQGVEDSIDLLLSMSQGSPLLAKEFSDKLVVDFRNSCFKQWLKVIKREENFIFVAEQWSKLDKGSRELLLVWLISWVMDLIKLKLDKQITEIINIDLISHLKQLVEKLDLKVLYQYYDFLLLSQQRLDTQLNKQLMFEEILIQGVELTTQIKRKQLKDSF